jgi:hypothetical protein
MNARGINDEFINDLLNGRLKRIFEYVKSDEDVSLEIRYNYITIYYKGGKLLQITQKGSSYEFEFDTKYCFDEEVKNRIKSWKNAEDYSFDNLNMLKNQIDNWSEKDTAERRFQHEILLNCKNILDIEYQVGGKYRIDMILSNSGHLVLTENKCGIDNVSSRSNKPNSIKHGLRKHYIDFIDLYSSEDKRKMLIDSMNNIIQNKYDLGLIKEKKHYDYDVKIDFLFVLYDYNHNSNTFSNEVNDIKNEFGADIEKYDTRVLFIEKDEDIVIDFNKAVSIYDCK